MPTCKKCGNVWGLRQLMSQKTRLIAQRTKTIKKRHIAYVVLAVYVIGSSLYLAVDVAFKAAGGMIIEGRCTEIDGNNVTVGYGTYKFFNLPSESIKNHCLGHSIRITAYKKPFGLLWTMIQKI